jgi:hypothetical protein
MASRVRDGTATLADHGYVAQQGVVTFAPGTTVRLVTVQVRGDTGIEPNETFNLVLKVCRKAQATVDKMLAKASGDENDAEQGLLGSQAALDQLETRHRHACQGGFYRGQVAN